MIKLNSDIETEDKVHFLDLLMDKSKDLICFHKKDSSILKVSASVRDLLAYEPLELFGKSFLDLVHLNQQDEIRKLTVLEIDKIEKTEVGEFQLKSKTDNFIWFETEIIPYNHSQIKYISISKNISGQKQIEESNNYINSLWNSFVEQTDSIIIILNKNLILKRINKVPEVLKNIGIGLEYFINKHISEFIGTESYQTVNDTIKQVNLDFKSKQIEFSGVFSGLIYNTRVIPIVKNMIVEEYIFQITDLDTVNDENIFSQNSNDNITHIGKWEYNINTKSLKWSKEVYQILEIDEAITINNINSIKLIKSIKENELVKELLFNLLETGKSFNKEFRYLSNNNTFKYVRFLGELVENNEEENKEPKSEIKNNKQEKILKGTILDISSTEESDIKKSSHINNFKNNLISHSDKIYKILSELETENKNNISGFEQLKLIKDELDSANNLEKELNNLKTKFITTISHEFRTPLQIIMTSTYLLKKFYELGNDDKFNNNIKKIENTVDSMTNLLENVLLVSNNNLSYYYEKVEATIEVLNLASIIEKEFDLKTKIEIQMPSTIIINTDRNKFVRVIRNILENAAKFSNSQSPYISILLEDGFEDIVITIKDNGLGIPDKDVKKIFEPFYRASNSNNIPGLGLGLYITKNHLRDIEGSININSKLDFGTSIKITIPKN